MVCGPSQLLPTWHKWPLLGLNLAIAVSTTTITQVSLATTPIFVMTPPQVHLVRAAMLTTAVQLLTI
jgi:hypothetical protein